MPSARIGRVGPLLRTAVLALLAATAAAPARGDEKARKPVLHHETYVLPNGLRVILHEDHALPVATVNLWYYVGAKDEPEGRSGMAHLFEHLMFMGTERVPGNQFDVLMESAGGSNNASTSFDRTNYFDAGPSSLLPTLLWLEADRMEAFGKAMNQKKLELQRDVVQNERRQSYEIAPYGLAELALLENMYPQGHPYRLGVIGTHAEIAAATVEDIRAFHARYYVPNNASLVVAGDFDPAEVKPLVERLFGSIPRGEDPARDVVPPVTLPAPRRITVVDGNVELARITFAWHSPPFFGEGDAEMDLLASVLAEGRASRLHRRLVHDLRTAVGVSAYQQSMALGSLFQIEVTAAPGADLDALEAETRKVLAGLLAEGPTPEELARSRNRSLSQRLTSLQALSERADSLNAYQYWLGTPDGLEADLARYEVAPERVREWGRRVLGTPNHLTLRVVSPPTLPKGSRDERPADARSSAFTLPLPERFTLANGLGVWHLARPGLPLVELRLVADAGALHDPAGKNGLAALSAGLLVEGAGGWDAVAFPQAVADLGAHLEASADRDSASLTLGVMKRNLAAALDLFAAAATAPRLATADVERVRARTAAALEQQEADPTYTARRLGLAAWFGERHPYGSPTDGRPDTVRALAPDDVRRFVAERWRPEHATLLVAGDVTRAELEPLLAARLGSWKVPGTAPAARPPAPPEGAEKPLRVIVADRPGAAQTVIRLLWPAPAYESPDREGLQVLNTLFGASFTSRLNANLREDKGYTYGAGSAVAHLKHAGTWIASSSVRSSVSGPALGEFLREIRRLAGGDVSAEEARKAGATRRHEVVSDTESLGGLLAALGTAVEQGREPEALAEDFRRIEAGFSADDLNALAKRHVALEHGVIVLVGDKSVILPHIAALSLPEPTVLAAPAAPPAPGSDDR
jgi:zinc protease